MNSYPPFLRYRSPSWSPRVSVAILEAFRPRVPLELDCPCTPLAKTGPFASCPASRERSATLRHFFSPTNRSNNSFRPEFRESNEERFIERFLLFQVNCSSRMEYTIVFLLRLINRHLIFNSPFRAFIRAIESLPLTRTIIAGNGCNSRSKLPARTGGQ